MPKSTKKKGTGYDKYVNFKSFGVALGAFTLILLLPMPDSMRDVAVEYTAGPHRVKQFLSERLFEKGHREVEQWQALTVRILETNMRQGALSRKVALKRDQANLKKLGIEAHPDHLKRYHAFIKTLDDASFLKLMQEARALRHDVLTYDKLSAKEKKQADQRALHIKVTVAMVAFVIICFITEAIPLPGVAFCIGLILVFSGMVSRRQIAQLFWDDAVWFIMGSLMFAAAFVKTGVDKRICLLLFSRLAKPKVAVITGILILVIAPAAAFISDHALAAMFLPVAIALYTNARSSEHPEDTELAKMLVICIAMACNIGGFGSPSGGARNIIMMTYLEDMFGITMGYAQWMLYGFPFVIIMMPVLWLLLQWRFKPKIKSLDQSLATLRSDISHMGGWNRSQIIAVAVFLLMLLGWITEKNLLKSLTGLELGIGVIAIAGAVVYMTTGVVNWRDYQEKVDWGVVWLYAGAIAFGRTLDSTGTAYWMARSVVDALSSLGIDSSAGLLSVGAVVTAGITNLMADGPAAAAVGPVTLNMAAVQAPGTMLVPFMALVTSCASSMAYLMIIGTPPNAIVYASGYLKPVDFLRVGIPCFFASFGVMLLLALVVWPLFGTFAGLAPM